MVFYTHKRCIALIIQSALQNKLIKLFFLLNGAEKFSYLKYCFCIHLQSAPEVEQVI